MKLLSNGLILILLAIIFFTNLNPTYAKINFKKEDLQEELIAFKKFLNNDSAAISEVLAKIEKATTEKLCDTLLYKADEVLDDARSKTGSVRSNEDEYDIKTRLIESKISFKDAIVKYRIYSEECKNLGSKANDVKREYFKWLKKCCTMAQRKAKKSIESWYSRMFDAYSPSNDEFDLESTLFYDVYEWLDERNDEGDSDLNDLNSIYKFIDRYEGF